MASLNTHIPFDVRFFLGGVPSFQITVNTDLSSSEQVNFTGYFSITQPDGITEVGNFITPDIAWTGSALNVFVKTLRLNSSQQFQNGIYSITLFANQPSYTPGTFTRSFAFTYSPVIQAIVSSFDIYTPILSYADNTIYSKGDFNIIAQSAAWAATTTAGSITPSTASVFILSISSNYYDATYSITYVKSLVYQSIATTWLTVSQIFSFAVSAKSYIPPSMETMLTYLDVLKAARDAAICDTTLQQTYEDAAILYLNIRAKVCTQDVLNLKSYFDEYYRLTHNYQSPVYQNTNTIIPTYDFTTGCGGSGGSGTTVLSLSLRATPGVSAFTVTALAGKKILTVSRGGFNKAITTGVTADTEYLQINTNIVTLPTGDIVATVTLPDGVTTAGELFTFTYS
jgi:hypothetical protein